MKIVKHDIHGTLHLPASFNDLLVDVCKPSGKHNHRVWMWRGQSDVSWRIDSSAYRRLDSSSCYKTKDVNSDLIRYEKDLLEQATHKGYRYEKGRILTDFELLAKLQHHGAATRLLDFTRNALIGLWFTCNDNKNKSGLLIGVDSWHLLGYEKQLEERSYDEVVKDLEDDESPTTWEPPGVSSRVAVQHSQFIYSSVSTNASGSLLLPKGKAFRKFKITPTLKEECLEILTEVFDIDRSNIFPDVDGFADANSVYEDINNMHRW